MGEYSWYCFRTILPKLGYSPVEEEDEMFSFYNENEPLFVLRKEHRHHPITIAVMLRRLGIDMERFTSLLQSCKNTPPV